ncbi:MAG: ABC transporter permease [Planctomycetes bacterium]|nr:ABC transporter permease [Planctomycetota bacterium]
MKSLWQDIQYGVRVLRKNPGFAVMATLSLVLGVTLNSTVFGLVDGIWLRSMPFAGPDRVIHIFSSTPRDKQGGLSYPDYLDLRQQMQSVLGLATCEPRGTVLVTEGEAEDLRADIVSRDFFQVLGVKPHLGRFFSERDEAALKDTRTVVLSHRLWQQRFGGDPDLVGKSVELEAYMMTVLAIAPPGFDGLYRGNPADVWFPVENDGMDATRDARSWSLVGRLKPTATVKQAQMEAEPIFQRLDLRDGASHLPLGAVVQTEAAVQFAQAGTLGLLLLGIVGTVLLLVCANVASLLLARAEVRGLEMAVRAALGGSRWRLVRQLLAESLVLASIATALSLVLAHWLIRAWPALLPPDWAVPIARSVHWDGRVVLFTCAVSLLSVLLFGLAPALHVSKSDLASAMKQRQTRRQSGRGHRGLDLLVVGQAAVALVLVTMAGLLIRSLLATYTADLGFEKKEILLVRVGTGPEEYGRRICRQLKERVLALPGVKRASVAGVVPFGPAGQGPSQRIFLPSRPASTPEEGWSVRFNAVDPDYFGLLGIPILGGRGFDERDDKSGPRVMIVNETMAKSFWPNEDPLGQWVRLGNPTGETVQIIGVVRDTKLVSVDDAPAPYFFLPLAQHLHWEATILAESRVEAATLVGPMRAELHALDLKSTKPEISTMNDYIRGRLSGAEFLARIAGVVGLLDLILASLGLYGVVAYAVNRRTREIGIRIALGGRRREVLLLVLKRGMALPALGAALGVPIAWAVGHTIRSQLYGVSPLDPLSIVVSLAVFLLVALLACYLPARRAAQIDPMVALRYE